MDGSRVMNESPVLITFKLQVAIARRDAQASHHYPALTGDHRQALALSRVDLAGHDRSCPGSLAGRRHFGENRRAAHCQVRPQVVGQLQSASLPTVCHALW